jgi:hypothetical protein
MTANRINTAVIQFIDEEFVTEHEKSEVRRYIDLLQDDGKLAPPTGVGGEYVFDTHGGALVATLENGTRVSTIGCKGVPRAWIHSDERYEHDNWPKTTEGVGVQVWSTPF